MKDNIYMNYLEFICKRDFLILSSFNSIIYLCEDYNVFSPISYQAMFAYITTPLINIIFFIFYLKGRGQRE